jgi:hypothetical protein
MGRAAPDIADGIRMLRGRFARWRKSHTGRLPIPDPLWAAAAEMAGEHGVFRTAKVLSLGYRKRKRLTITNDGIAYGPAENGQTEHAARRIYRVMDSWNGRSESRIELEGARGKMGAQWKGSTTPGLAALRRAVWAPA